MAGPHYRLQTFGELRLVNSGGVAVACPERGALILAYLCVSGEKTASREKLAMLIWPEREKSVAFKNLRSTLWRMRHLAADLGPLITATEAEVTLGEIACDVDGFRRWNIRRRRSAPGFGYGAMGFSQARMCRRAAMRIGWENSGACSRSCCARRLSAAKSGLPTGRCCGPRACTSSSSIRRIRPCVRSWSG